MATRLAKRLNMFNSARLSLTLFYLGIIVLFNLLVTLSVRIFAEHEFQRGAAAQRQEIRNLNVSSAQNSDDTLISSIDSIQDEQSAIVSGNLNEGLLIINLYAFAIGGILSYWFAGRALQPIRDAHEAQARFTADASHEMKTPLANIRLENEIFLRHRNFTYAEAKEQIESNLEEIERLEKLSLTLLALHQYGQKTLERSAVVVAPIVEEVIRQFDAQAKARKAKYKTSLSAAKVFIHADSIEQLLSIILDNAFKYGDQNNIVSVTGVKRGGWYVIAVSDKGPGIDPKDLPHIFDRLYRGDKARSTKTFGFGLGLALAKEIAIANEAVLKATNNKTGGARFEVWQPLHKTKK